MPMCRHCQKGIATRPRGLCRLCYYRTGVRAFYPSTSKYARRGVRDFNGRPGLPPFATGALPGTLAKIEVLKQRASLGLQLWHPDDAPLDRRLIPRDAG
jgi:hypothetical protein